MSKNLRAKTLKRGEVAAALLSATLFILQFLFPSFLFWVAFCWMVPLVHVDRANQIGFRVGFLWGLCVFSVHLSWLAYILFFKSLNWYRIIVYVFTVIYYSSISGLFFLIKQQLAKKFYLNFAWGMSLLLFFVYTVTCSLFFLGNFWDGYPFIHPLLPIASYDCLMMPIRLLGAWGFVFCILLFNACIVRYFSWRYLLFSSVLVLFLYFRCNKRYNHYAGKGAISWISPLLWQDCGDNSKLFYGLSGEFDRFFIKNANCRLLVLPESSFPYNLAAWTDYLPAWSSLNENCSIVIGGHCFQGDKNYNTAYHIQNGRIVGKYHKQHLVPFTERIPVFFGSIPGFKNMFVANPSDTFAYSDIQSDVFYIMNEKMQVYICSELYFQSKLVHDDVSTILVIANDNWLAMGYMHELAYLCARLFAFVHQKKLIYASFYKFDVIKKGVV